MNDPILSASQIQTYVDCPRKWGFRYLDGIKTAPHPAAELGTATHLVLAKYLESGEPPNPATKEGRIALAGIKYLPTPGIAKVEQAFTFATNVASYRGFIDFQYEENGVPVIGDHKTTAGFFFAQTPWQLRSAIQPSIYAKHAFLSTGAEKVKLRWVYYATQGRPKAKVVELDYTKTALANAFHLIDSASTEMLQYYREKPGAKDLRPNLSSCEKFGGCAFKSMCPRSPMQTAVAP